MTDSVNNDLCLEIENLLSNNERLYKIRAYVRKFLKDNTRFEFARSYTPDDIINGVFEKILTGNYSWDKSVCTFDYLFWLRLKTYLGNIIKHEKWLKVVPLNDNDSPYVNDDCEYMYKDDDAVVDAEFMIESNQLNIEEMNSCIDPLELTRAAFEIFSDSPEEFCVLDELYKGKKPREIASYLGITVETFFNIRKRIKRTLNLLY